MKRSRYSLLLRFLLALVAFAGLLYWGANTHDSLERDLHSSVYARQAFTLDPDTRAVTTLQPEAVQGGLVKGSVVESLNGLAYSGEALMASILHPARSGQHIRVGFTSPDGAHHSADVVLAPLGTALGIPRTRAQFWQQFLQGDIVPLLCMLIGYWVVFVKVDEANAWLLLVLLLYPGVLFTDPAVLQSGQWFDFRAGYYYFFQNSLAAGSSALCHLFPGALPCR